MIQVNREGYFTYPESRTLPAQVAQLTIDSPRTQQLFIDLAPGAAIGGRITDSQGNPLQDVKVSATKLQYDQGRRIFSVGPIPKTTDDRGQYRIFWLPPGEYYIRAEYGSASGNLARRSYYPGTLDSTSAAPLTIRGGESFDGMDFALPEARNIRISGRVSVNNVPGPAAGLVRTFYLLPRDGRPVELYPAEFTNTIRPQPGQTILDFVIEARGIAPGSYDLAPFYIDSNTFYTGRTRIEIADSDLELENVIAAIGPNINVTGSISMKTSLEYAKWRAIHLELRSRDVPVPLTGRTGTAELAPDGTFTFRNVVEGRYQLYGGPTGGPTPSDLYIASIRQGGLELQDEGAIEVRAGMLPLEITLSAGGGRIEGAVETPSGSVPDRAAVVLVPQFSRRRNLMLYDRTAIDAKGRFSLTGIAPGEYKVFAFEQLDDDAEQNPEFIARYETLGQGVTVNSGTTSEIRVRLLR